jgi:hypothetical protein
MCRLELSLPPLTEEAFDTGRSKHLELERPQHRLIADRLHRRDEGDDLGGGALIQVIEAPLPVCAGRAEISRVDTDRRPLQA